MIEPQFYRLRDVMEIVGVTKTTIYRWVGRGQFPPAVKLGERAVAWRRSDIEAWINSRPAA